MCCVGLLFFDGCENRGCIAISSKEHVLNEKIKAAEVRLIGSDNNQIGIMHLSEAQKYANESEMDLVLIAPQANPPVVKIMDYGKYKFDQQKREKEARKSQKVVELKEIRLSVNIGDHDFNTKIGHAQKFLEEGNKVKASIRFRGREMVHASLGREVMERFADAVSEYGSVDKLPKLEGRSMQMIIMPNK
jgi:translation initiation factor IF-3